MPRKKDTAVMPGNNRSTLATQAKIETLAEMIVKSGATRQDILRLVRNDWGLSATQADRYYSAAINFLRPKDREKYREMLIDRNFEILEELLKRSIERNDTKSALDCIKLINNLLGVGGNQVEIKDKDGTGSDRVIKISFTD